jgi:hypothetical protein
VDHAEDREGVGSVHGAERAAVLRKTACSPGRGPWWLSSWGGGGRGGGGPSPHKPPPLVHRFRISRSYLAFVPSPTERSPPSPHPTRAAASSPAPRGGGSHGDIRWNAAPGGGADAGFPKDREESASENQLETGSSPGSPRAVGRGGYRHGVGLTGRGRAPSPVSASCLQRPDSIPTDCHTPVTPSPQAGTRTFLLKAPAPGRGQYVGIPGCKPRRV